MLQLQKSLGGCKTEQETLSRVWQAFLAQLFSSYQDASIGLTRPKTLQVVQQFTRFFGNLLQRYRRLAY